MSIQPEIFTVIFKSKSSNVLSIGIRDTFANLQPDNGQDKDNYNRVTYNVNWLSILPTKYKKFQCQFVFKSKYFNSAYTGDNRKYDFKDNGIINMNIGRTNNYDGLQMSSDIGIIQGVSEVDGMRGMGTEVMSYNGSLYYCSTINDNNSFSIDYPLNNQITISLNKFSSASPDNLLLPYMSEYCLFLTLTGILDNEIDKSN
jgi:hypothetical protein